MDVTLQYFEGCPNWQLVEERLRGLAAEFELDITYQTVGTPGEAEAMSFRGSPSILIAGRDLFARGDEPSALACRMYDTPDGAAGSPTVHQLRAALSSAAK